MTPPVILQASGVPDGSGEFMRTVTSIVSPALTVDDDGL